MRSAERHRDAQKNLVVFVVGDVRYALDSARVTAILNPLPVTALPHTPPEVAGVADHRGEVVPVLDLRRRFGLPPAADGARPKWILVESDHGVVGLVVDGIPEVAPVVVEEVRPAPDLGGRADARAISGVLARGGKLTFLVDLERITAVAEGLVPDAPPLGSGESA